VSGLIEVVEFWGVWENGIWEIFCGTSENRVQDSVGRKWRKGFWIGDGIFRAWNILDREGEGGGSWWQREVGRGSGRETVGSDVRFGRGFRFVQKRMSVSGVGVLGCARGAIEKVIGFDTQKGNDGEMVNIMQVV
jgi:hypothetical protein